MIKNPFYEEADDLYSRLATALDNGLFLVLNTAQRDYMSGPRPKYIAPGRTGVGRNSLVKGVTRGTGLSNLVSGFVGISTVAWYLKLQEFGYPEGYQVGQTRPPTIFPRVAKMLKLRYPDGTFEFRSFTRGIPARPFLWPAIEDNMGRIRDLLFEAIGKRVRKMKIDVTRG